MAALATAPVLCNPLYILLRGNLEKKIADALSYSGEDVDCYDGETYSQLVDASILGNPHWVPILKTGQQAGYGYVGGSNASSIALDAPPTIEEVVDEAFVLTTAPGKTLKTRTLLKFWSAAAAGGSVVGEAWLDQIISWGPAPAVRVK